MLKKSQKLTNYEREKQIKIMTKRKFQKSQYAQNMLKMWKQSDKIIKNIDTC